MSGLFSFADTIAGYVTGFDPDHHRFGLETTDGRAFDVRLTGTMSAEIIHNLDQPYLDALGAVHEMLVPGRYLFAYGVFYAEHGGLTFEAQRLIFVGRADDERGFEKPDWWVHQVASLGDFYLHSQFPGGTGRLSRIPHHPARSRGRKAATTGRRPTRSPAWSTGSPPRT